MREARGARGRNAAGDAGSGAADHLVMKSATVFSEGS
jgi:hypothetical protein